MKIKNHLKLWGLLSLSFLVFSYGATETKKEENESRFVCKTDVCKERAKLITEYLDTDGKPCENFYAYTCKKWMEKHASMPSYDAFQIMRTQTLNTIQSILSNIHIAGTANSVVEKAGLLYQSCLSLPGGDSGSVSLLDIMKNSGYSTWPITDLANGEEMAMKCYKNVLLSVGTAPILQFYVARGMNKLDRYVIKAYTLSFRKLGSDALIKKVVNFVNPGLGESVTETIAGTLLKFEESMMSLAPSRGMRPSVLETTIGELKKNFTEFPLQDLMNKEFQKAGVTLQDEDVVEVYNFDAFTKAIEFLQSASPLPLYNYLGLRFVLGLAEYASTTFQSPPQPVEVPRSEECASLVFSAMKEVVGYLYAKDNVPVQAKYEVEDIVNRLKKAFIQAIEGAHWIDEPTKTAAKKKVENIVLKIAYPAWLHNTNVLEELYSHVPSLNSESSFAKMMHIVATNNDLKNLAKLRKQYDVDKEWLFSMSMATAFYNPGGNELVCPMGGLRSPFYGYGLPKSVNFGGIGAVLAHEISHSFTGRGIYYDEVGRQQQWWTDDTKSKFAEHSGCFVRQYGSIVDEKANMTLNGHRTLDENVADNMGLQIALKAYSDLLGKCKIPAATLDGLEQFSGKRLFLVSYGMAWCSVMSAEHLKAKIMFMPHSPNKYRVNIPIQNLEVFDDTFSCPSPSNMAGDASLKCSLLRST